MAMDKKENRKNLRREKFEKKTIKSMVEIYCKYHHNNPICKECNELLEYAYKRIEKCPLMPEKPTCKNCHIHCYDKKHKEQIKNVMRFSGPKMFIHHPILSLLYFKNKFSEKKYEAKGA